MNEKFLREQYEVLCKELGHLEYHKQVLEQKLLELRERIKSLDLLIPLAAVQDKKSAQ